MPLNCDTFSHTFYLQNPFCDNLKKNSLKKFHFIYLFMATLDRYCCVPAFFSCEKQWLAVCWLLTVVIYLVAERGSQETGLQQLWHTGLVAPLHVGSSWTRDQARVPCIGRWILTTAPPEKSSILLFNDSSVPVVKTVVLIFLLFSVSKVLNE